MRAVAFLGFVLGFPLKMETATFIIAGLVEGLALSYAAWKVARPPWCLALLAQLSQAAL